MADALSLLGLAYRAGKVYLGENCLDNMKKVRFLFIAADASAKTKERYLKKCAYYGLEHSQSFNSDELSKAIGKHNVKIIGISDDGFKRSILTSLK